jgi:uncharacterized damage-inducible protein DinB
MPGQVAPSPDERTLLLAYVAQQREAIRIAAHGLTDEQARLVPTRSSLSVGGLIKHVSDTERGWIDMVLQRERPGQQAGTDNYLDQFTMRPDESLADVLADNEACGRETEEAILAIADLNQDVPVPKGVPWFPDDVDAWSVRWVLLHLIEEIARHAGHADIIRESIDGATGYELMAAAEGWPETPWLKPWSAPDVAAGAPA